MLTKSIPIMLKYRKVEQKQHMFNVLEARAITCFNTGNLVYKDTHPNRFRSGHVTRVIGEEGWMDGYLHVSY